MLFASDLQIRPTLEKVDTRGGAEPDDDGVERLAAVVRASESIAVFNGIDIKGIFDWNVLFVKARAQTRAVGG